MLVGLVLLGLVLQRLLLNNRAEACDMVWRVGRDCVFSVSGQCS